MSLNELTRDDLIEVILAQAVFTEGLRKVANRALAHSSYLVSNFAKNIPDRDMKEWANAQIDATVLLTHPAPVAPPTTQ